MTEGNGLEKSIETIEDAVKKLANIPTEPASPTDVAQRACDTMEACENAADEIEALSNTILSMANEIKVAGDNLAADIKKRAAVFNTIVERFAGLHQRHSTIVSQLSAEIAELDQDNRPERTAVAGIADQPTNGTVSLTASPMECRMVYRHRQP